jgi:hypothetical protein
MSVEEGEGNDFGIVYVIQRINATVLLLIEFVSSSDPDSIKPEGICLAEAYFTQGWR